MQSFVLLSGRHKCNALVLVPREKSSAAGPLISVRRAARVTLRSRRGQTHKVLSSTSDNKGAPKALTMPETSTSHVPGQTVSPEITPHEMKTPAGGGAAPQSRSSVDAPPSQPQSASSAEADARSSASDPVRSSLSPARSQLQVPSPSLTRLAPGTSTPTTQAQAARVRKVFKKEALVYTVKEGPQVLEIDLNDPASIPYHVATMNLDPHEAANLAARRRARNKNGDNGVPLLLTLHREGKESPRRRRSPQLTPVISRHNNLPPTPKSAPPSLTSSGSRKVSSQSQRVTFTIPEEQ